MIGGASAIAIVITLTIFLNLLSDAAISGVAADLNLTEIIKPGTKDLIQVYGNCETLMLTDKGRPIQHADVKCYDDEVELGALGQPMTNPLATFKFGAPTAFQDSGLTCFACKSKVYAYGENDFELVLFDGVGEKRYPVRLFELPN